MTSERYRVQGVTRALLPHVWPLVEPMLSPALERDGAWDSGEVYDRLDCEQCVLWIVLDDDVIVAAMVIHLRGPALVVWLMGGRDFRCWAHVVEPLLMACAREQGVERVQANARPGFGRLLPHWGKRYETIELRV